MMGAPWPSGPWTVEDHPRDRSPVNIIADGTFIAVSRDVDAARLIAAAPDLAEAAEPFAAIDFFPDAPSSAEAIKVRVSIEGTAYETFLTIGDFRRIRAALSKARGETP